MILAIDPGNTESAYVVLDKDLKPVCLGKVDNSDLLDNICHDDFGDIDRVAVEMIASYGMAVGKEVFDTCVYIGQLRQAIRFKFGMYPKFIYRKDEKMNLCNSMKANDSNIIQALVDRFAPGQPNKGKGTKKNPGWFYGFKKDIWQAYAVGVTYHDMRLKEKWKEDLYPLLESDELQNHLANYLLEQSKK